MDKKEYQEQLKDLQHRLALLHSELYRTRIPVILAFEGWDAAGKGGALHRKNRIPIRNRTSESDSRPTLPAGNPHTVRRERIPSET